MPTDKLPPVGLGQWPRRKRHGTARKIELNEAERIEIMTALRFLQDWRSAQARSALDPPASPQIEASIDRTLEQCEELNLGIRRKLRGISFPKGF